MAKMKTFFKLTDDEKQKITKEKFAVDVKENSVEDFLIPEFVDKNLSFACIFQ